MVANANICFLSQISSHLSDSEGATHDPDLQMLPSDVFMLASLHPPNASPTYLFYITLLEARANLPPPNKVATLTTSLFAC